MMMCHTSKIQQIGSKEIKWCNALYKVDSHSDLELFLLCHPMHAEMADINANVI
jgi:hypothetical protein